MSKNWKYFLFLICLRRGGGDKIGKRGKKQIFFLNYQELTLKNDKILTLKKTKFYQYGFQNIELVKRS